MSREQDQKLVRLYEKIVRQENLQVGDRLEYIGDNKKLRGQKATITEVKRGLIKIAFDTVDKKMQVETPLIKTSWKRVNEELLSEGKKRYREQHGIGKSKYTISFHDGKKKHSDGSDFFDIRIFKNKKALDDFKAELDKKGYLSESIDEGAMKELAFDLGEEMSDLLKKLRDLSKRLKRVHKNAASHVDMAAQSLNKAYIMMPIHEETINEFKVSLKGNKVPIGLWSFEYIPAKGKKDIQFLINSMKHRDPQTIIKLKNSVVMEAYAGQHDSLIISLVRLQFDGEVVEWDRKEKGVVVYQKEGK